AGGVKRKNLHRTIQIQSAVTDPSLTPIINAELAKLIDEFKRKSPLPPDVVIRQTGESEQQAETLSFLGVSMLTALLLIFLILVLQFNSLS
ncbi:efflux RND transporter permease subunit, partial [Pseudomonas aeruginosa]